MITPEKVRPETLEQRLLKVTGSNESFNGIHEYVKAAMFSRYLGRRKHALKELNIVLKEAIKGVDSVELHKLEQDGIIYVYMSVNGQDRYTLVRKYDAKCPISVETVPTPEGMKMWKSE